MKAAWGAALGVLFVCSVGRAEDPAPSPSEPGVYHGIRKSLRITEPPPPAPEARALHRQARDLLSHADDLSAALRRPGASASVGVNAAYKPLGDALSVGVGLDDDLDAGVVTLSSDLKVATASLEITINQEDRSIEVEMGFGRRPLGADSSLLIESVAKLELTYPDNRTFLTALGVDAGNVPGMRTAMAAFQHVMRGPTSAAGASAPPSAPQSPPAAALGALRAQIPPMFEAGARFETAAYGAGYRVTGEAELESGGLEAAASISTKRLSMERITRTDPAAAPVTYEVTAVGVEMSAGAGRGEAGASIEFEQSTDPEELAHPKPDGTALMFADMIDDQTFELRKVRDRAVSQLDSVLHPDDVERTLARIDAMPGDPGYHMGGAVAVEDPEVGGVRLSFDPAILGEGATPAEAARWLSALSARLDRPGSFVVDAGPRRYQLHARSLRALAGGADLGGLTRLRGYVLTDDDVLLLGEITPGAPPIDSDVLTVALRAMWKDGREPFVSIDPDPADFHKPHRARIGELPPDLHDSAFVATMLEADHDMKRINLGQLAVHAPGFRSSFDLHLQSPPSDEIVSRYWLRPPPAHAADVWEASSGNRRAVLFESRVQVATERMKQFDDMLRGAGDSDPVAGEASWLLTLHYDAIAREVPSFARLAGLFDAAKLAAVLRARQVAHPVLDTWAARPVRKVTVPREYAAIGPVVLGTTGYAVTGGATTRGRVREVALGEDALLAPVLAATAGGAPIEIALPDVVELDPARAAELDAEVQRDLALELWADGRGADALARLDKVRALAGDSPDLSLWRGIARLDTTDTAAALGDLNAALAAGNPELRALVGMARARAGDAAGARADLLAAEAAFPDDVAVATWAAWGWIYAFELPRAEASIQRLLALEPLDAGALDLGTHLTVLHRLGPERARRRVAAMRAMPLPLADAISETAAALRRFDFSSAAQHINRCRALARAMPEDRYHADARCAVALVIGASMQATVVEKSNPAQAQYLQQVAAAEAQALAAAHPDWPTPQLLLARSEAAADPDEAIKRYYRAIALDGAGDPLLEDLGALFGSDAMKGWYGLLLWYGLPDKSSGAAQELVGELTNHLPRGRLAHRLWAALDKAGSLPPDAALSVLRDAATAIPEPLPTDPVDLWSAGYFTSLHAAIELEKGDRARARAAILRFLRISGELAGISHESLSAIAAMRLEMLMMLGELETDPAAAEREGGAFAGAVVRFHAAKGDPRAGLTALAAGAHTPIEVRTVTVLLDGFRLAASAPGVQGTPEGARFADLVATVGPRLRATRTPSPPARDWAGWGASPPRKRPWILVLAIAGVLVAAAGGALAYRRWRLGRAYPIRSPDGP